MWPPTSRVILVGGMTVPAGRSVLGSEALGMPTGMNSTTGPHVLGPGLLLGVGLGGFVDGIVLHQLLRWHHLLSSRPEVGLTTNLIADGVFHAGTWLAVLVGVLWLWRRSRRTPGNGRWTPLIAAMLAGWGLFNVVEGIVNHYILNLHHVRPGPNQLVYDVGFLIFGAALAIGGLVWYQRLTRAQQHADAA
jgi:uncharacterized membrane protein